MQNLTRRQFGKGISITIFAAMTPGIVVLEGCTLSMQEIENLINTALNAANAVLKVAEPGAPWVADFSAAITALEQAEASWKAGGTVAIVEAALNTLAAITAVIPITAVYSPLIDILVAGIDAVLSALPVTTTVAQPSPLATKVRAQVAAASITYDHHGRATIHNLFGKPTVGAFTSKWNGAVAKNPALAAAKI
jgi:hypothetical protein